MCVSHPDRENIRSTALKHLPIELSEDAITFQAYSRTFERTGITDGTLQSIQEHGYLLDWTQERWENAQIELAQARLVRARQQYQEMDTTGIQDMMGGNDDYPSAPLPLLPGNRHRPTWPIA